MLKILFFMIGSIFLCNMFMYLQFLLYIVFFLFCLMSLNYFCYFNFSSLMMIDLLSYSLIMLTIWLVIFMMKSSMKIYYNKLEFLTFNLLVLFLLVFLFLSFSMNNLFMFYLCFETSLILIFMIIMGWGNQPERLKASIYILFYTLVVSLPLLISIFFILFKLDSLNFYFLIYFNKKLFIFYFVLVFVFLVKMPMFLVHLWLPKAHVESPVSGSMILAGVMLKLGGYGLIRILVMLEFFFYYSVIWVLISLLGAFMISFFCLSQSDLKILVAYSSVVHMSFVTCGIFTFTYWGIWGSLIMMLGHGLCSSALFMLINVSYERVYSRNIMINKGLVNFIPSMMLMWFLLLANNIASPISLNLVGELSLMMSMIYWSSKLMLLIMLISFFSSMYSLYLFLMISHGKINMSLFFMEKIKIREYLILFMHWIPLNILFIYLKMFYI
uniref:NADH-ubiquinone oxidoreductase chain 4 n=1 Tax=Orthotrichia sp. XG-2021 TaxID=2996738 RepID=A0A9E8LP50_9NEOP|nr:NADH dehydrogenase subunit 4 [Orthotrichia sp. XG-2021]